MLARRRCATRICLSCRFALARPELVARGIARPTLLLNQRNHDQRLFGSSLGLRRASSNNPDTSTDGQKPPPVHDPFALLEANRRLDSARPVTKTKRKRKSKSRSKAEDDTTNGFSLESWDALPATETKPKSKRKAKSGRKAGAHAPDGDPLTTVETGHGPDNPRTLVDHRSPQGDAISIGQGKSNAPPTEPVTETAPDSVQPIENQASTTTYTAPPVPESRAVNEEVDSLDDNDIFELEKPEKGTDVGQEGVYAEQSTVAEDKSELHELQDRRVHKKSTRGTRGRSTRQDLQHRQIGIDALGQPGAAIILDNPDALTRKRSSAMDQPPEEEDGLAIDLGILKPRETFDSPQSLADEAMANIDELNLRGVGTLSEKELQRYRDTLAGSFTMKQLDAYLQAHAKHDDPSPTLALKEKGFKSVTEFTTEWTPNTPDIPPGMTRKQLLAFLIITRAWDVEVSGSAKPGSMQLKLNSDLYAVLAQSTTGALNFAKARLDETVGESISFDLPEPTIEVRCRKESVRSVLNRLESLHGAVKVVKPSSLEVPDEFASWSALRDEIARITGTAIGLQQDQIVIRWMEYREFDPSDLPAQPATPIENKGDVAMRLLRGQQNTSGHSIVTAVPLDKLADLDKCTHIPHLADTRSMNLSDKLRSWTRWTAPTPKAGLDTLPDHCPLSREVKVPSTKWQPNSKVAYTQHLNASFGHILHSSPKDLSVKSSVVDRILSPKIPHPAAFNKLVSEGDIARSAFILLKFTPTQKQQQPAQKQRKSAKNAEPPTVHLKLPVSPDTDFANFTMPEDASLYAERLGPMHDVLLPENPVDVRLAIQDRLAMSLNDQPALLEFFAASDFNLAEGQLLTPPKVELSVPSTWSSQGKKAGGSPLLAYDFAGLEVHQVVSLEWQAQLLQYSSIEAGQQGGRRQQLTLECQYTPNAADLTEQHGAFLKAVDDIALGRAFPWTDGHKLVVEDTITEDIPEDITEAAESWMDALGPLPMDGDLATASIDDAAFTVEQLSVQVTAAAERLEQLSASFDDTIRSHTTATSAATDSASHYTTNDTANDIFAIAGEEPWAAIATEECEAAIVDADELMEVVEDALTSFMGEDPTQSAVVQVDDDLRLHDDVVAPVAGEDRETLHEQASESEFMSPNDADAPTPAIDDHDATFNAEPRDDVDQTTDKREEEARLTATTATTDTMPTTDITVTQTSATDDATAEAQSDRAGELSMPEEMVTTNDDVNTGAQADRAEASSDIPETQTTPGQAPDPPVYNKKVEVDESSPWGHAWSLFR